jgi:hypothetical protein
MSQLETQSTRQNTQIIAELAPANQENLVAFTAAMLFSAFPAA